MNDLQSIIANHPVFQDLNAGHVAKLASHATTAQYEPGHILFREGEVAWQCYLLLSGKIALEACFPHRGCIPIQCIEQGEMMGWSWLFAPYSWHFQGRVIEPTEVLVMDGSRLLISCEEDHDFGYELMKRTAQVLIHRFETLRRQVLKLQLEHNLLAA